MITRQTNDTELAALAAELMRDYPGMSRAEAIGRAAGLLEEMQSYAASWDSAAAEYLPISLIETAA